MEIYKECKEFKCGGCNFTANVRYSSTIDQLKDEPLCCHCIMEFMNDIKQIELRDINEYIECASCQANIRMNSEDLVNTTCQLCKEEAC